MILKAYVGLLTVALLLVGCGTKSTPDPMATSEYPESEYQEGYYSEVDPKVDAHLELGSGVVLHDFAQRQTISSPLTLTGVAPRRWYFEAVVPVTLMTLEEEPITILGAVGPTWLEEIDGERKAEDLIPFSVTLEFDDPGVDMGKLRIAKDQSGEGGAPEYVETMVLFE